MIKENRTYDQVLGSLGKGDGDPLAEPVQRRLGAQPPRARPPLHAVRQLLRRRRRLRRRPELDDLGGGQRLRRQDVADHLLARRAPPPPRARLRERLVRRAVPDRAARVRPHDLPRRRGAHARLPVGQRLPATACRSATTACTRRSPATATGPGNTSDITHLDDRRFGDHVDEYYPGFNLDCSDHADRYPEWEREFRAYEAAYQANPRRDPLPALTIMRLPNDHTFGTTPNQAIPESYFADNDLALGRLVDTVSHSPFWPNTAILVTEDDAQNGPDHVDAHRTLAYVISPYTQTGRIDSTHYDTASMVATRRVAAGPAADDDRRPARDADVEGLLAHARPPPLRRDPAVGDPVRGGGRADQREQRAAGRRRRSAGTSTSRTRRRRSRSTRRSGSRSRAGAPTCPTRGTSTSSARSPRTPTTADRYR